MIIALNYSVNKANWADITEHLRSCEVDFQTELAARVEIQEYAQKNDIQFREDSTNQEVKYLRNHLRQLILPEFEKITLSNICKNAEEYIEEYEKRRDFLVFYRSSTQSYR